MGTFDHQSELPHLPIPPLEDSIKRYIEVLKPIETDKEHEKTVLACKEFLDGVGPILQEKLIKYAKDKPSYIEQFWYDSYLNYDNPVVLNINPFVMIEDDPTPLKSTQITRASSLTASSLRFIRALRKKELPIDMMRNGIALDMDQYPKLFGSARIPTQSGCILRNDPESRHIVVLSKSQFYWFDVLDDDDEILLTEDSLSQNFRGIVEDSKRTSITELARSSFGILTSENRRVWANMREKMNKDRTNKEILKIIDGALFIVVLDDVTVDDDSTRMAKNFLCGESLVKDGVQIGSCTNRWYDKMQIILTKDAKCGINFEHTGVDGHTVLRFASDIYTDSILRFAKTINSNSPSLWPSKVKYYNGGIPEKYVVQPRKLEWNLTKDISLALRFGETRLSDLIRQNEFATLEYKKYAKDRIKRMGMSPDAYIQMGFQLAYYKLYGKIACTYEPAMTKIFYHGRTEAIRTVSEESNLFVTKFFEEGVDSNEKIRLLREACKKHHSRTGECRKGLGQDRHLYALLCIWKLYFSNTDKTEEDPSLGEDDKQLESIDTSSHIHQIPAIFSDPGWTKLNDTIISTSNCGNPSLKLFGFGPVSPNGFGVGYIIKDNWMTICASSKHRQTDRFLRTLKACFDDMDKAYMETSEPKLEILSEVGGLNQSSGESETAGDDAMEQLCEILLKMKIKKMDVDDKISSSVLKLLSSGLET